MNWYIEVLRKYAVFHGRARRAEYWSYNGINLILMIGMVVLDVMTGRAALGVNVVLLLYALAVTVPGLAVTVRRLHDTGRSGWWTLVALIPLLGLVVIIILLLDSEAGDNQYGPNPKDTPSRLEQSLG